MIVSGSKRSVATVFLMLVVPLIVTILAFVNLLLARPDDLSVGNQLVASPAVTAVLLTPTTNADFLYQDGVDAYDMGRYEAAEELFREALVLMPDSAVTHNRLGMTLVQLDRPKEAILTYQEAITFDPTLVEAHYNLGMVYQLLGHVFEAEQAYNSALNLDKTFALAYIGLGELYLDQEDFDASMQAFERATTYAPDQAVAWRGLGASYAGSGDWEHSAKALQTAVSLHPDNAMAHYDLGIAYAFLNMETKARREFTLVQSMTEDESLKTAADERLKELPES